MSNIIIYDPFNIVVANRVTSYLLSVNTPDYDLIPDKLINPDMSSVSEINQNYWKVDSNSVVEMSPNEKTAVDNFILSKTLRQKKYRILSYDITNKLDTETWYDTDNGDGTYSGIAEQSLYTYSNVSLIKKVINTYYYDGTISSTETIEYFNSSQKIIEKNS